MAAEQVPELGFDPDELRERYEYERLKRLRDDGADQYIEIAGTFARYAEDDPYADPAFTPRADRPTRSRSPSSAAGSAACSPRARLTEQGVTDFRIIEAGGDFGGTWYWNRYPGAQCDIESYCYLPLLEELGYMPKEKYSFVTEIFEHSQRIGQHYGLYDKTCFQTRVRSIDWDERAAALAHHDQPRRRHQGPLRGHGARHDDAGEAARHPGHRRRSRATPSTPAAGTTTTPAATRTAG